MMVVAARRSDYYLRSGRHGAECVVLRIGNKNGAPLVEVTCFLVEVTLFFS